MLLNPTKCYSVARLAVMADNIFFFFLDFQSTKEPESWARFLFFWGGGARFLYQCGQEMVEQILYIWQALVDQDRRDLEYSYGA